eukprot:7129537-Pyramimonas_sp.AAC.1
MQADQGEEQAQEPPQEMAWGAFGAVAAAASTWEAWQSSDQDDQPGDGGVQEGDGADRTEDPQ